MLRGWVSYAALVALAVLAGRGLLLGLRARLPPALAWLLALPMALACGSIALALLVHLGRSLREVAPLLALTLLPCALWGARDARRGLTWRTAGLLLACLALPAAMLAPHFATGLRDFAPVFVSDGWGYVANASYLWERPNGALGPLHAFALGLTGTRHCSAAWLALLSPFEQAGDPQRVVGLYCAFLLGACACGCAALARAVGASAPRALLYVLLAVPAGWVAHVFAFSNYDQGLALSLLPASWALLARLGARPGRLVAAGLLAAAPVYAYPELAPLFLGSYALALPLWSGRGTGRRGGGRRRRAAAALAVALVALLPQVEGAVRLLSWQLQSVSGPRPGGLRFAGLTLPSRLASGLWGLGGEMPPTGTLAAPWIEQAGALLLTLLALAGARALVRRRSSGRALALLALLHVAGAASLLWRFDYHYGSYKLLSLGYFALAFLAWQGLASLSRAPRAGPRLAAALGALVVVLSWRSSGLDLLRSTEAPGGLSFARLRDLERQARPLWPAGVLIDVASPEAQQWSVYFLRTLPLRVQTYRGYLGNPTSTLWQSQALRPAWRDVAYRLEDGRPLHSPRSRGLQTVIDAAPLRLMRLRADAALVGATSGGVSSQPAAHGALTLHVHLRRPGMLRLRAKLAVDAGRQVRVHSEGLAAALLARAAQVDVLLPLAAGPAQVEFEPLVPGRPLRLKWWALDLWPPGVCPEPERLRDDAPLARLVWLFQDDRGAVTLVDIAAGEPPAARRVKPEPTADLRLVGAADFDGDGWLDLALQDERGAVRLWLLDDSRARREERTLAPRPGARAARLAAFAHLGGDSGPDLLWQERDSRAVEFQWSCGAAFASAVAPSPARAAGPAWSLAVAGDLDGDGAVDLLWSHPRTRRVAVWFLDRRHVRRHATLLDPPDAAGEWTPAAIVPPLTAGAAAALTWQRADGRLVSVSTTRAGAVIGRRREALTAPGRLRAVALERVPSSSEQH